MIGQQPGPRLLSEQELIRTGPVDHAAWNFHGLLGAISRARFSLIRSLLPRDPVENLLEIGFGSGVFLPELSTHCKNLYGADIHDHCAEVMEILARRSIGAILRRSSAGSLPFVDALMDVVVAVSALEFVEDMRAMSAEIARVLRPGGSLVMVMPGENPVLDMGLRMLGGTSAKEDYGDRRRGVVPRLCRHLTLEAEMHFPYTPVGKLFPVYKALRLRRP